MNNMSEIKVSEMMEAENINDNDLIMIVQNNVNKKAKTSKIKTKVVDNLESESSEEALSAKQGKILNEKIINFVGTQNSDGYCKLPNGLKLCWGKVNSNDFESFSGNGGYRHKVNLPITYEQFYFPIVCSQYSMGFPNVNVCSTPSLSELYLGSSAKVNNAFVNWLTIGV